jgi:cephalosporin hydroxylase
MSEVQPYEEFRHKVVQEVAQQAADCEFRVLSKKWFDRSLELKYSYHFEWMGRPIIQYPQDVVALQEVIWKVRPDLIIETGIAHGGSIVFSASMLALLDVADAEACSGGSQSGPSRKVVGIDIDVRPHNRAAIEAHPMVSRIEMLEGSSTDPVIVERVYEIAAAHDRILVCLDSNHTHNHVRAELDAYAPLTSLGSYCIVFDTVIEDMPPHLIGDRPWAAGNSPMTAVNEYLRTHEEFQVDHDIDERLMITAARRGYLRRVR